MQEGEDATGGNTQGNEKNRGDSGMGKEIRQVRLKDTPIKRE